MRLTLIRHGQSVANAEGRLQGHANYPLSEQGMAEAKKLGLWLADKEIDRIYSSDLTRAFQTAQEIAKHHNLEVIKNEELREMNLGRFQGLTRDEIEERYPDLADLDWLSANLEDVESADQLYARTSRVVQQLLEKHWGQQIYVVSHGGFIGITLMAILSMPWKGKRAFAVGNTSMTTIDFNDPQQFVIVGVNEAPHLTERVHKNAFDKKLG